MKYVVCMATILLSVNAFACPDLTGRYSKCQSEINPNMRGEYIAEEYIKDGTKYVAVKFIDDETDEERTDTFRTDGVMESRKEKVPNLGITVKIETRSRCEGDKVIGDSEVFFLGKRVGSFVTKIFKQNGNLNTHIDGKVLTKVFNKRIVCLNQ